MYRISCIVLTVYDNVIHMIIWVVCYSVKRYSDNSLAAVVIFIAVSIAHRSEADILIFVYIYSKFLAEACKVIADLKLQAVSCDILFQPELIAYHHRCAVNGLLLYAQFALAYADLERFLIRRGIKFRNIACSVCYLKIEIIFPFGKTLCSELVYISLFRQVRCLILFIGMQRNGYGQISQLLIQRQLLTVLIFAGILIYFLRFFIAIFIL